MHAFDGPVVKAGNTQSTPVAHSFRQHVPGIPEVIAIFPGDDRKLSEMVWLSLSEAKRDRATQAVPPATAYLVCHY
jgi:hypothetical protein